MLRLTCPHCGFSKDLPSESIPPEMKAVNCPKCRHRFPLLRVEQPSVPISGPVAADEIAPEVPLEPTEALPAPESTQAVEPPPIEPTDATCPQCGYEQQIPAGMLVGTAINVNCQQCQHLFIHRVRPAWARKKIAPLPDHPGFSPDAAALAPPSRPRRQQLAGFGELLSRSWGLFRQRSGTLLGIGLLALVPTGVAYLFLSASIQLVTGVLGEGVVSMTIIGALLLLTGLLLFSLVSAAAIFAMINDELGALSAFLLGLQKTRSFYRVSLLLCFVLLGGYLLFLPLGIVLSCWFGLALFVHASEDEQGMDALLKSREYTRGHAFAIGCHLLLFAVGVAGLALLWLASPWLAIPCALLSGFYALAYAYQLYRDLHEIKPSVSFVYSGGAKLKLLGISAGGYLAAIGLALVLAGPATLSDFTITKLRVMLFPHQASLSLPQTVYAPGEVVTVYFKTSADVPADAWLGIIPAGVPHGDEAVNDQYELAYQHLEGRRQGTMMFRVPEQPGDYDLRLHDTDVNGRELVSVSFKVVAADAR